MARFEVLMARKQAFSKEAIAEVVAGDPDGMGIEALQRAFPDASRRSLQRYLAALTDEGVLVAEGSARARRYVAAGAREDGLPPAAATGPAGLPLSPAGIRVREVVRRPPAQRRPVGYRREFLDGYRPNRTHYLPASLRAQLHRLGRSPAQGRPAGTYARQVLDRLLIDLSWASSRLEGNTYSRLDTQNLIQFGQLPAGKDQLEAQMILNHKAAIEMLVEQAEEIGFNRYTVQNLHALLAENLLPDAAAGGRPRRTEVAISGSVYAPLAIPQQIEDCFDLLLAKAGAIEDPFEQAFFAMVHLPYLQPFDDINKRTSRLAANVPLIRNNLSPLSFVDVPEDLYIEGALGVYELNRIELLRDVFAWAYERSCQRYTVLRDALPAPDPLRLRHREAIRALVSDIVAQGVRRNDPGRIRQLAAALVDPEDVGDVVALATNELHQLHEGNIARYRLRPSQFREWLAVQE
ncbi:Fic family protein [Luteimonas salinilitoris]|uniref:Fic family protein n=1 Tax=Luteimonas salinilitoris TaxID=3237697 RepID=A0ABV4HPG4_9GAMM